MRENMAKIIVIITGLLVVILSMFFSALQNPDLLTDPSQDKASVASGSRLFLEQGCVRCHSFKGEGNSHLPLDESADKYTHAELISWITGADDLKGIMSSSTMKIKSKYQLLTREELGAIVEYLQQSDSIH